MEDSIGKKIGNATKWSIITELLAKLITPISSMILARLLVPEIYGVVTSISMVVSFSDLFTDSGFQKYIIQHQFNSDEDLNKTTNVAFWTNLIVSLTIWGIIAIFATPIAKLVGNPGKQNVIIIACISLPLTSFSSIQSARLKRDFNFKALFGVRLVAILVPFVITVPMAILTRSYWALIVGTIATNLSNAIVMTIRSDWKPKLCYDFKLLKKMLSFSIWSMLESILVWLVNWGDTFIVGYFLTSYYLGIYKASMSIINQIVGIVSAVTVPIMLTALSKLQHQEDEFKETYYQFNFLAGILIIPMGVGLFIYKDLVCEILFGSGWSEAATFMGIWGLISCIALLFNSYNGNVLISKGRPKISVIIQIIQIIVIILVVYWSMNQSFEYLAYARSLSRFIGMLIYIVVVWKMYGLSFVKTLKRLAPTLVATAVMGVCGIFFVQCNLNILLQIITVFICIVIYFIILFLFPSFRKIVLPYLKKYVSTSPENEKEFTL